MFRAVLCALACALLLPATSAAAPSRTDAALAQERYYMGQGTPDSTACALAQERYYASFGRPAAMTLPQSHTRSGGTPWMLIALSLAATATVVALSTARLRVRRRAAA